MISLTSDTETRPTAAMRRAMAAAEVGDEQRGEDPTVNRLQERVADLLGKEAALWFPGGTMCNLVAIKVHTRPGDAVIVEAMAHIMRAESAGPAVSSGIVIEPVPTERGVFSSAQLQDAIDRLQTAPYPYAPPARLVCVEQTHNFGGGTVWSLEELVSVAEHARAAGLAVHMDGARLLNAAVAASCTPAAFAAQVDSLWLDFTKGLGAPVGAVLAGSRDFIHAARRQKHIFGGAMRQAGIVAAGCLHALDHHVERLAADHANARYLAAGLAEIDGITVKTRLPETNIVLFDVSRLGLSSATFLRALAAHGVRMSAVGGGIRAVTHLDISQADIDTALSAVQKVTAEPSTAPT